MSLSQSAMNNNRQAVLLFQNRLSPYPNGSLNASAENLGNGAKAK